MLAYRLIQFLNEDITAVEEAFPFGLAFRIEVDLHVSARFFRRDVSVVLTVGRVRISLQYDAVHAVRFHREQDRSYREQLCARLKVRFKDVITVVVRVDETIIRIETGSFHIQIVACIRVSRVDLAVRFADISLTVEHYLCGESNHIYWFVGKRIDFVFPNKLFIRYRFGCAALRAGERRRARKHPDDAVPVICTAVRTKRFNAVRRDHLPRPYRFAPDVLAYRLIQFLDEDVTACIEAFPFGLAFRIEVDLHVSAGLFRRNVASPRFKLRAVAGVREMNTVRNDKIIVDGKVFKFQNIISVFVQRKSAILAVANVTVPEIVSGVCMTGIDLHTCRLSIRLPIEGDFRRERNNPGMLAG